jgi:hypothetical protein
MVMISELNIRPSPAVAKFSLSKMTGFLLFKMENTISFPAVSIFYFLKNNIAWKGNYGI